MKTRLIIILSFAFLFILKVSAQKLKLITATQQTLMPGMGGAKYVNYVLELKQGTSKTVVIDSVVSVAGLKKVKVNATNAKITTRTSTIYTITYSKIIPMPPCCGRENLPPVPTDEIDFTEGVIVYYTINGKRKKIKVSTFKVLANINAP
jgi:hypothetical protein